MAEVQVDDGTDVEHEPEKGKPSSYHVHWRGDVGLYAGDVGLYAGDVGDVGEPEKFGEVGEYDCGLVGDQPGEVGVYLGEVGDVGDRCRAPPIAGLVGL